MTVPPNDRRDLAEIGQRVAGMHWEDARPGAHPGAIGSRRDEKCSSEGSVVVGGAIEPSGEGSTSTLEPAPLCATSVNAAVGLGEPFGAAKTERNCMPFTRGAWSPSMIMTPANTADPAAAATPVLMSATSTSLAVTKVAEAAMMASLA